MTWKSILIAGLLLGISQTASAMVPPPPPIAAYTTEQGNVYGLGRNYRGQMVVYIGDRWVELSSNFILVLAFIIVIIAAGPWIDRKCSLKTTKDE